MKQRVSSAIIAILILIPFLKLGGIFFHLGVYVLSLLGLKEFMSIKETKKTIPLFVKFISYIILTLIMFGNSYNDINFLIDYRIIAGAFLVYLMPTVLYHNNDKYSIVDAFYLLGGIFFLGISFGLLVIVRNQSLNLLIYLLIITVFTDTFAFVTGKLIGKNKLLESISPKKTWEGSIGGTLMATIVGVMFYSMIVNTEAALTTVIALSIFLSIISQFGDLVFSSIKRYFGKKDFSNIMPGHGGILDRLDSIIFVLIGYMFIITLI